jgi:glucose/mannose-6-phosphate isomerase
MMAVLDDLKLIHARDAQDALGVASKQSKQLLHDFQVDTSEVDFDRIDNVLVGGMGGSALASLLFTSWPGLSVPFEVVRAYDIPAYANGSTLFIASSYSGNTEETLSALAQAEKSDCQIVVIASGGKLGDVALSKGYPFYRIPSGYQPRMATLYNYSALVQLFEGTDLAQSTIQELKDTARWLREQAELYLPEVPTARNPAKQLALELAGSSVVIYAGTKLSPAAYKWKISMNENAKTVAWWNQLPEYNHNEFLGWTSHPIQKPYKVIELRSNLEHQQVVKRFEVSDRLLSGKRPAPEIVEVAGETHLQQLLWTVQYGDFVSLYLALLNGLNPTPVDIIERLKQQLA